MSANFSITQVTFGSRLTRSLVAVVVLAYLMLLTASPWAASAKATGTVQITPKTVAVQLQCAIISPDNRGYFGKAVSLSADGNRSGIGAEGTSIGAVYIYDRTGSSCTKTAELTDPVSSTNISFFAGPVLSQDGHSFVAGINGGSVSSGTAYIFNDNGGNTWTSSPLTNPDAGGSSFNFGSNVTLSGDGNTALVQGGSGGTYVYTYINYGGNWAFATKISSPNGFNDATFAHTMTLSNDGKTAFIASESDNSNTGAVYVYTRNTNGNWGQPSKITAQDGVSNDHFGSGLALSHDGSTLAIGAYNKSVGTGTKVYAGATYVFTYNNGNSWSQQAEVSASDAFEYASFGDAVALSNDGSILLVGSGGAYSTDNQGTIKQSGTSYVFTRNSTTYTEQVELAPPVPADHAGYGGAVALSNDGATALVGSSGVSVAYLYSLTTGPTPAQLVPVAGNNQTAALGQPFAQPFQVAVNDANGNPVPNVAVTFQAPTTGPGGTFANPGAITPKAKSSPETTVKPHATATITVNTDINGVATSPTFTANNLAGSYTVTATVSGLGTVVSFQLTNSTTGTGSSYNYYLPLLANGANTALGTTTTYITFQNLSNTNLADVRVQYYNIDSGAIVNLQDAFQLGAKGQKAILPAIGLGTKYGGVVTSDQPLNVVVSEALSGGGSAYNVSSATATTLYSPIALAGAYGGYYTTLVVFNAGPAASSGTIQFYDENGNVAGNAQSFTNLPSFASQTFKQNDPASGLNSLHTYWAKIVGNGSLTAQVIELGPNNFVATFNTLPQSQAQTKIYAPAVFNGGFGYTTGMQLANPNSSPAQVTISYFNADGSSAGSKSVTVVANGVAGVYQGAPDGPAINFNGSARITSSQPIVMTVNERGPGTISGTYIGLTSGSTAVALPVMANGFAGFVTGTTILNTSNTTRANLTLTYLDANGNTLGIAQNKMLEPNAGLQLYQGGRDQNLPSGFFGTAVITSDQPLLVTTNALNTSSGLFYTYTEPSN